MAIIAFFIAAFVNARTGAAVSSETCVASTIDRVSVACGACVTVAKKAFTALAGIVTICIAALGMLRAHIQTGTATLIDVFALGLTIARISSITNTVGRVLGASGAFNAITEKSGIACT